MKFQVIITCLFLLSACGEPGDPASASIVRPTLWSIEEFDVVKDVEASISQNDFRFCGIYGYAVDVPGVPKEFLKGTDSSHVWMIEGTSDDIQDVRRQALCRKYAEQYNKMVVDRLKSKGKSGS